MILIATGNLHKVEEFRRILSPLGITAVSAAETGFRITAEETGLTFEENARIKAFAFSKASNLPCIADDSGLEVDALGGAPGIYSARYAGPEASDGDRIKKLLAELADVPADKRGARFVCAVCCVFPDGGEITARGECEGTIAFDKRGTGGFGYDPVFLERSTGECFAELSGEKKDSVSHRGKALRAFVKKLEESGRMSN